MSTQIIKIDDIKPSKIYSTLQAGNIIAYPTNTIYGIGADIYNSTAVDKLFDTKKRDYKKTVSLLYFNKEKVIDDFAHLTDYEKNFINEFFPGSVTLLLKTINENQFPFPFIDRDGYVGIRVIDHPKLNRLMDKYPNPITTTSINPAGEKPAESTEEILNYFPHQFSIIIDDGPTENRVESTTVLVTENKYSILRESAVSAEEIERRISKK